MGGTLPIKIKNLSKQFKKLQAVRAVSLTLNQGEHVALLGPNGAGKTTLMEMIEGIQKPSSGEIELFGNKWGKKADKIKPLLGITLQETRFRELLTVIEIMCLFASFYHIAKDRINEVIEIIGLEMSRKTYYKNLSGGQKQRLALGVAIMHQPKLLLLDEPTTGLDPKARHDIWKIIEQLKTQGTAMILTTHYMEEAEILCDRIIMMHKGEFIAQGQLADMLQKYGKGSKITLQVSKKETLNQLLSLFLSHSPQKTKEVYGCFFWSNVPSLDIEKVINHVHKSHGTLTKIECHPPNLNDVFLSLSGASLDD